MRHEASSVIATVDRLELVIPGEPIPNARARRGRSGWYTPAATTEYRERVRQTWMIAGRPSLGALPFAVSAQFYRAGRRVADLDNLLKSVLDALNGLAWADDAQAVCFAGIHRLEADEQGPRTVLTAWCSTDTPEAAHMAEGRAT